MRIAPPGYPVLSIVVPLHNEERRLPACMASLITQIEISGLQAEIILVPNGCGDRTTELAIRYHETVRPWVRVLALRERGKGAAVRNGMLTARGKFIYMADVDLSTPAREILNFLDACEHGYDVVIGSRELCPERTQTTPKRRAIGRVFHLATRVLVPGVRDTQCGFKMFRREAAQRIFRQASINGLAFDVEALYLARRLGLSILEISVDWKNDPDSRVRMLVDSPGMLMDVLTLPLRHANLSREGGDIHAA